MYCDGPEDVKSVNAVGVHANANAEMSNAEMYVSECM